MATLLERKIKTVRSTALNALRENVLVFRAQAQLSQTEFANRAQLARPVVSKLEQGTEQPSFESLAKIAAIIGCEIADLLLHRHKKGQMSEGELQQRINSPADNDIDAKILLDAIEEANATRYSKRGRKPVMARHRSTRRR